MGAPLRSALLIFALIRVRTLHGVRGSMNFLLVVAVANDEDDGRRAADGDDVSLVCDVHIIPAYFRFALRANQCTQKFKRTSVFPRTTDHISRVF